MPLQQMLFANASRLLLTKSNLSLFEISVIIRFCLRQHLPLTLPQKEAPSIFLAQHHIFKTCMCGATRRNTGLRRKETVVY